MKLGGLVVCACAIGCGSHADPPPPKVAEPPPQVRFGDCTTTTDRAWISGPRPQALDEDSPQPEPPDDPAAAPPAEIDVAPPLDPRRAPFMTSRIGSSDYENIPWYTPDDLAAARARWHPRGPWVQFAEITGHPQVRMAGPHRARAALAAAYPALVACYVKSAPGASAPDLSVHISYELADTGDGLPKAKNPHVTGAPPALAACIAKTIVAPLEDTGPVGATLIFHAAGIPPDPGALPAARRAMFAEDNGLAGDIGRRDPLQQRTAEIARCLAGAHASGGAVLVDATLDPAARAIAHAIVRGSNVPPATTTCIANAVIGTSIPFGSGHPIGWGAPDAAPGEGSGPPPPQVASTTLRCSLAFGDAPASDAPIVAVHATGISIGGTPLGDPRAQPPGLWIDALYAHAHARHAAAIAQDAPPIALHVPYALAIDDDVSMAIVTRTISSVLAADEDFVFGAAPPPLPAPVPLGTGLVWNKIRYLAHAGSVFEGDEMVVLSVLVTPTSTWTGMSRLNEVFELKPAEAPAKLAAYKTSAFFTDRTDVRIAATPDTPYGRLRETIATLEKVGFTDWQLGAPEQLWSPLPPLLP